MATSVLVNTTTDAITTEITTDTTATDTCILLSIHIRGVIIKFPDWYDKKIKKYKELKNRFISIQSNLRLLGYMRCIV